MMLIWITLACCWFAMGIFMVALCRVAAQADGLIAVT
jgi:hypothetical protein